MRNKSSKSERSTPYPGTQAVLRAVALLKTFTADEPEWGLSNLARAVRLNKTTAYRLLTALESEGMVARAANGEAYRLGPAAVALGGHALRATDLRSAARQGLESLAQTTQETATLEVEVDGEMLILDEVSGSHVLGNAQSLGTRWPMHATSTGKAVLAFVPEAERKRLLKGRLARLTARTITRQADLRRDLATTRERGFSTAVEELEEGFTAVGAPIRNHAGQVVGAISLGGPSLRLTSRRIVELGRSVAEAAAGISHRLGL